MKLEKNLKKMLSGALISLATVSGAHAAGVTVICGDASLGIRTTTVDPAMAGSCYAGLDNLGDPALLALVNSRYGETDAILIDRDAANSNGGLLSITGIGGASGGWSFASSLWSQYDRMFLYFHFGDAKDDPGPLSETDPDIFLVELVSPDSLGTWVFSGKTGLSNIALIGSGCERDCETTEVPEPGTLALLGLALTGLGFARRRRS
jgi:hypothetical protein